MKKILYLLPIILLFYGTANSQQLRMPGVKSYTTGIDSLVVSAWIRADSAKFRALKIDSSITISYIVYDIMTSDSANVRSAKFGRTYPDSVFATKIVKSDTSTARSAYFHRVYVDSLTATVGAGGTSPDTINVKSVYFGRAFPDTNYVKTLAKSDTLYARSVKMGRSYPDSVFVTKIAKSDTMYARSVNFHRAYIDSLTATVGAGIVTVDQDSFNVVSLKSKRSFPDSVFVTKIVTTDTLRGRSASYGRVFPDSVFVTKIVKSDTSYARSTKAGRSYPDSLTVTTLAKSDTLYARSMKSGRSYPDSVFVTKITTTDTSYARSSKFGRIYPDSSTVTTLAKSDTSYARSVKMGRSYPDTVTVTTLAKSDTLYARSVKMDRSFPDSVFATKIVTTDTSYARSSKFGRIDPDTVRVTKNVIADSLNARSVKFTRTSIDSLGLGKLGTSTLPVIFPVNDRDTGMYFPGSNNIEFVTAASTKLNLYSTGVSLGSGQSPYHSSCAYLTTTTHSLLPSFCLSSHTHNANRTSRDTAEDTSSVYARITNIGAPVFGMRNSTGANVVLVDSLSNIGIGTGTPGGSSTKGTNSMWFKDGTAPAGGTAYQAGIFADSLADDAHTELFCIDAGGTVTQLTAADALVMKKIDSEGNVTEIDIEALAVEVEKLTGKTLIKRSKITPWPHETMPVVKQADYYLEKAATELISKWRDTGKTDLTQLFIDGKPTEVLTKAVNMGLISESEFDELKEAQPQ